MTRRATLAVLSLLATPGGACRPAPKPAAPLVHLNVAHRARLSHAAMAIAEEEGFFRQQGLEVEFHRMERSKDALPSLIAGDLDVLSGFVGPSYFNAIARGAAIRIVGEKGYFAPQGCTFAALVTLPRQLENGRLRRPKPPRPWRISARPGSVTDMLVELALAREGIALDEVRIDWVEGVSEAEALQKGMTDVAFTSGPEGFRPDPSLVTWHTAQELAPELSLFAVLFGPNLLQKNPDAGERFMTAFLQGVRQYNQGKTERNLSILERRLGYDRATLQDSCWIPIRPDARPDLETLRVFQEWAVKRGLLERLLTPSQYWEPRFVDFANRALATPPSGSGSR